MKFENLIANKNNSVPFVNREWTFIDENNRPALVRIKEEKLKLYLGQTGKRHIHDGQFVEAWSCKIDEPVVTWEMVVEKLTPITIKIID